MKIAGKSPEFAKMVNFDRNHFIGVLNSELKIFFSELWFKVLNHVNYSHVNVWRHSLVLTRRSPAFYSLVEATCNRIKTIFLEFRITSKSNLTAKIVIFTLKMSKIANSRIRIMLNVKMLHSKMLHKKMLQ